VASLTPRLEVIADIDGIEAGLFGCDSVIKEFDWRVLLWPRLPLNELGECCKRCADPR
jgi:hypothetical protein